MRKMMIAVAALCLAAACSSTNSSMMTTDRAMISSSGTMTMTDANGSSRALTDQEMQAHMTMLQNDPRYASTMSDHCRSMGMAYNNSSSSTSGMSSSSSGMSSSPATGTGTSMMVMNADGTTRPMTDAEYRSHLDMVMRNPSMASSMSSRCSGSGM